MPSKVSHLPSYSLLLWKEKEDLQAPHRGKQPRRRTPQTRQAEEATEIHFRAEETEVFCRGPHRGLGGGMFRPGHLPARGCHLALAGEYGCFTAEVALEIAAGWSETPKKNPLLLTC